MSISAPVQTLTAAFLFGILVQAVSAALFLYFRGHGTNIFRDGRRLVLMLFLLFSGLWAQVSFFNLMVEPSSPTACQVLLVFTTTFDQVARVVMEQFLLWALSQGTKVTAQQLVLQGTLLVRLVAGGVLVGFTRPDFAPVCLARTSQMPVDITVLTLDVILIGVMLIRAFSSGMFRAMHDGGESIQRDQGKAFMFTITGFTVWTAFSVPMTLGFSTVILIVRTVLPTNGLLILVGVVTIFSGVLLSPKQEEGITPEARSPFTAPTPPSRELFKGNLGNGSPIPGHNYTKSGGLFVVNPSSTPRDSPTTRFQGNYQGDTRGFTKLGEEVRVRAYGGDVFGQPESKNGLADRGSNNASFSAVLATPLQAGNQVAVAQNVMVASERMRNMSVSAIAAPAVQQKKSMFSWSKAQAKTPIRSLGISKPVMEDSGDDGVQPFPRMATIDLATAAANERERREGTVAKSNLIANRPAPDPPSLPPAQEGLRKSISLKRKVPPPSRPAQPMPAIASSSSSSLSVDSTSSSATSVSLSPSREEVRRRSPRNADSFEKPVDEKPLLRPSFPRKATTGLPLNPKSQRMAMPGKAGLAKEQTVMFLNDIVYDNPTIVKTIIDGAPEMYASTKRPKTAGKTLDGPVTTTLQHSNSVIHRPRPIKRDSEKDRILFPSEPSPSHRRSRSATSIGLRKSLLASLPGSPTELPPLPPPPTSAMKLRRLLPNDMKSMTFDEKIELLFPAPPGVPTIPNRRSSVPSLPPRISATFLFDLSEAKNQAGNKHQSTASKRTTIGLFGPLDLGDRPFSPDNDPSQAKEGQTSHFSTTTRQSIADQVGETWIPGISATEVDILNPVQDPPKRNSGFDAKKSSFTEATSSDRRTSSDSATYWGSIHSELPAIDLSKARRTARSTFIERGDTTIPPVPSLHKDHKDAIVAIATDLGESHRPAPSQAAGDRTSFLLDADQASLDNIPLSHNMTGWHRRIGDELPTFSERRSNSRSRKMPPPTPLLLNRNGRQATVVVHAPEPSPISPPERAIQEIQAQLKRFEDTGRESVGSIIRHLPNPSNLENGQNIQDSKFQLLENLEKEMGQQETQWQHMQNNLDRDSLSIAMTPHDQELSENGMNRESSQSSSQTPSRVLSRRARIRSSMTRSRGEDSISTVSTLSSDNSRASIWQQRLAEAQVEYLEKAPPLLRKQSMNFLSTSSHLQLGSPTPPESIDSDSDQEVESGLDGFTMVTSQVSRPITHSLASLWKLPVPSPKAATGRLWNPPYLVSTAQTVSPGLPAKDIRPKVRRAELPLKIRSSTLWSESRSSGRNNASVGLWQSKITRPRRTTSQRATKRPQRKSKRITFLPDIVESPTPLPDKRDTLGIFQFPWGEQSDSAVYQPVFNPIALGPSLNANLQARSRQLEPESNEYSSSFFDDYDDEHDDDDIIGADSDDDFDETTLWEIASLLKSTNVPSKNSLLPPPTKLHPISDIIEDYDDESDYEDDTQEDLDQSRPARSPAMKLPTRPLTKASYPQLWTKAPSTPLSADVIGLPQPYYGVWRSLVAPTEGVLRLKPQASKPLPAITSSELWAVSNPNKHLHSTDRLSDDNLPWVSRRTLWSHPRSQRPFRLGSPLVMWTPPKTPLESINTGLFEFSNTRSNYQTTSLTPPAINMARKPRIINDAEIKLESNSLWVGCTAAQPEHHWISESSIRPDSPSVYSNPSSGESSPASDASSVKSTSTKASSLWGSIGSAASSVVPWWDRKSKKTSPSRSPQDHGQNPTKIPALPFIAKSTEPTVKQMTNSKIPAPVNPLQPPRESIVLVHRSTAKVPTLDNTPTKKFRRPTAAQPPVLSVHRPLRHQFRPTVAFHANWDAALAEAVNASTAKSTSARPKATRADWTAALNAATMKSEPPVKRQHTPKEWNDALNEAISKSVVVPTIRAYNPSFLHPVFFTDKLISKSTDIHPAAIGYVTSGAFAKADMWSPPVDRPSPKEAALWSKGTVFKKETKSHTSDLNPEPSRRAPIPTSLDLQALNSSSLWSSAQSATHRSISMVTVSTSNPQSWAPYSMPPATKMDNKHKMWSAPRPTTSSQSKTLDIIGHGRDQCTKECGRLTSNQPFDLALDANSQSIHWLHATSKLPEASNLPMMSSIANTQGGRAWTKPMAITPVKHNARGMWESRASPLLPELFLNPPQAHWNRKKVQLDSIKTIESTEMWRPSMTIPQSPKNWLVKRRFSKVEFRY